MERPEAYLLLFTDTFVSNLAISASSEMVFDSMAVFGGYRDELILLAAMSGYMLSACVNYLFGIMCRRILAPLNKNEVALDFRIEKIQKFRFLPIIIILSGLPFFGKFIVVLSGFCQLGFRRTLIICFIAKLGWYLTSIIFV